MHRCLHCHNTYAARPPSFQPVVLHRLAAQVSQFYKDIEELDGIQQLRKYLGQVLTLL